MKYTLLLLIAFSTSLLLSCSKDSFDIDAKKTHIDYVGSKQVDANTNFTFIVSSDYEELLMVRLEAVTVFNEKILSEQFALTKGEKKEITLQKQGVTTFDYYIKSYQIIRYKGEDPPLKRPSL